MKRNWTLEIVQWVLMATMFIAAALMWKHAPDRMPTHWNLKGEVDGYGGKFMGLLLLPLTTLGMYLLFLVLPKIDPGKANYHGFARTYGLIRVLFVGFMSVIYLLTSLAAFGYSLDVGFWISFATGGLMILIGNYLGKVRPNWFVGVRTPWTLSSKLSWTRTHRQSRWVFMVLGISIILMGLLKSPFVLGGLLALNIGLFIWLVAFSWWVWRNDPDRAAGVAGSTLDSNGETVGV